MAGLLAALLLGFAPSFWGEANIQRVYRTPGGCDGSPRSRHFVAGPAGSHLIASQFSDGSAAGGCTAAGGSFISPDGCCMQITPPFQSNSTFAPLATLDLSTLGFVPAFHVDGP